MSAAPGFHRSGAHRHHRGGRPRRSPRRVRPDRRAHFVKGVPDLRRRQPARHWERYTTGSWPGCGRWWWPRRHRTAGDRHLRRPGGRGHGASGGTADVRHRRARRVIGQGAWTARCPQPTSLVLVLPAHPADRGAHRAAAARLLPPPRSRRRRPGAVVDQDSPDRRAGRAGGLGRRCLDVFTPEPLPAGSPLWGSTTCSSRALGIHRGDQEHRLTDLFLDNLDRLADGPPAAQLL